MFLFLGVSSPSLTISFITSSLKVPGGLCPPPSLQQFVFQVLVSFALHLDAFHQSVTQFISIYTALGHSCETDHVCNFKDSLSKLVLTVHLSQSMIHVLNGKNIYTLRATDALTTKINRLSQDMRVIDKTFSSWQFKLNEFAAKNQCHESLLLEFLSKHANSVNQAFASLLRLTEMQDVLHQFSTVETKTLFGFPHLPPFLHPL